MSEVPTREAMPAIMIKMTELAGEELDSGAVVKIAEVINALCLDLTDMELRYYLRFGADGEVELMTEDPGLQPTLTITTTSETLHNMAIGVTNPAKAFAMRKVKISGVPTMKLGIIGGDIIDMLFRCYREALGE